MNTTNIPLSLTISTQLPVDGKTYKPSVSEINNVTAEKAFTYYTQMIITVADTGKRYVWKPVDLEETPISNIYTYPANHTVDGYNYSNKQFAFYEFKEATETPEPPVIPTPYRAELRSIPYNGFYGNGTLFYGDDVEGPTDGYMKDVMFVRPIASSTLNIYNPPSGIGVGQEDIPLRIEYFPNNAIGVGEDSQYETIEEAINEGATHVAINPTGPVFQLPDTIDTSIALEVPFDVIIATPAPNLPVFNSSASNNRLNIGASELTVTGPIANVSNLGSVALSGTSQVASVLAVNSPTRAAIRTSATPIVIGAMTTNNVNRVVFENLTIDLSETLLIDAVDNCDVLFKNCRVYADNTSNPIGAFTNANVTMTDCIFEIENFGSQPLFRALAGTKVRIERCKFKGFSMSIVAVDKANNLSPEVSIVDSDLTEYTGRAVYAGTNSPDPARLSFHNSRVNSLNVIENTVPSSFVYSGIYNLDGDTMYPMYESRVAAIAAGLGNNRLFIRTDGLSDKTKYELDIVIK